MFSIPSQLNKQIFIIFALFILITSGKPCNATLYTYTDSKGTVHYTNVPTDPRYRPLNRNYRRPRYSSSKSFDIFINAAGKYYDIDPLLIKAIIKKESSFNQFATSKKGAKGLMQLMPETALDMDVNNVFDPQENIFGGTRYLRFLANKFNGNLNLVLASYNAGPTIVSKTNSVPNYKETKHYIRKVMSYYKNYLKNQ